ncbi:type II secretion system protein [Clostridium sp. UBA5712]|uniref:type II secretion system protein n=1 Tax=Clostridium sp. UBA5712 TaxID=1946368 RepID=UPI0032164F27
MIKRANNKKKKGFTLIELIIVLAVMAIIALIAIPNFAAVRDNSKNKADKQSCETIERTVLMLVSDETIKGEGTVTVTVDDSDKVVADATEKITSGNPATEANAEKVIAEALAAVKAPQGKVGTGEDAAKATKYTITIDTNGKVDAVTAK